MATTRGPLDRLDPEGNILSSERRSQKRTPNYDMKFHPMDSTLRPNSRATRRHMRLTTPAYPGDGPSDDEHEDSLPASFRSLERRSGSRLPTMRRSSRQVVNKDVNYSTKVHPQDADLDELEDMQSSTATASKKSSPIPLRQQKKVIRESEAEVNPVIPLQRSRPQTKIIIQDSETETKQTPSPGKSQNKRKFVLNAPESDSEDEVPANAFKMPRKALRTLHHNAMAPSKPKDLKQAPKSRNATALDVVDDMIQLPVQGSSLSLAAPICSNSEGGSNAIGNILSHIVDGVKDSDALKGSSDTVDHIAESPTNRSTNQPAQPFFPRPAGTNVRVHDFSSFEISMSFGKEPEIEGPPFPPKFFPINEYPQHHAREENAHHGGEFGEQMAITQVPSDGVQYGYGVDEED